MATGRGSGDRFGAGKKRAFEEDEMTEHDKHQKHAMESIIAGTGTGHEGPLSSPDASISQKDESIQTSEDLGANPEITCSCSGWNGSHDNGFILSGRILDRLNFHYEYSYDNCSMQALLEKGWEEFCLDIPSDENVVQPNPPFINGILYSRKTLYEQPFIQQRLSQVECIENVFVANGPVLEDRRRATHLSFGKKFTRFARELSDSYISVFGKFAVMEPDTDITMSRYRMEKFIFWISTLNRRIPYESFDKKAIYQEIFQKWALLVDVDLGLGSCCEWTFKGLGDKRMASVDLFGHVELSSNHRSIYTIAQIEKPQSGYYSNMTPPKRSARSDMHASPSFHGERFSAELAGGMIAAAQQSSLTTLDNGRVTKTIYAFLVIGTKVQLVHGEFSEDYLKNFAFTKDDYMLGRGEKHCVKEKNIVTISRPFDLMLAGERTEILRALVALQAMAAMWESVKK